MSLRLPRVPSLQHLARMVDKDPAKVEKNLWQLVENSPRINYIPSQPLCKDRLRLGIGDDHVLRALESIKGDKQRNANTLATSAFLKIVPEIPTGRFIEVDVKHFALGRNIHVPVNPFLYQMGTGGNHLLWTSFWANLTLKSAKQAFFWTILEQTFFRSPDYRGDRLCFLDLGKQGGLVREPLIMSEKEFPTMSAPELKEYSDAFVLAYLRVRAAILRKAAEERGEGFERIADPADPLHLDHPY